MNFKNTFLCLLVAMLSFAAVAQNGTIRGKVIEDATGEELIGVTVLIAGTSKGAITDFDGTFQISAEPGTYDVQVSFVSFETVNITGVEVKSGEVTLLNGVRLKESIEELEAVTITAEVIRNSEAALLTVQKKSANLLDGISAQTFQQIGDSDAAGAIRRVSGVSVQGGQYVYVRGLGDRYTKTILNNMEVPGLDPDRNAMQIDIFPTNIIDNIIVLKSFTPELSADFVGGLVNIETKDFPEEKILSVSASMEYTPGMHFVDDYLTYSGGGTDFLGFDDGTRELPIDGTSYDIPSPGTNNPEVREATQSFNRVMGTNTANSFANYSLGISAGNQYDLSGYTLGYNAALSYKKSTDFYEEALDASYIKPSSKSETELEADTRFTGPLGVNDVQLSGLLGTAIKWKNSKISVQGLHIQNGTERAAMRTRVRSNENFNTAIVNNLEYTERFLTNGLITGEHHFGTSEIKWKGSITNAIINDKDVRITPFTVNDDDGSLAINPQEGGEPNRIWRLLDEQNYVAKVDYTKEIQFLGRDAKLKAGLSNIYKTRDFQIQDFFLSIRGSQEDLNLNGDPNNLLTDGNIISASEGLGVAANDRYVASNSYEGRINTAAAYVSGEFGLAERLKTILGVRVEQYDQYYTGLNQEALSGSPSGKVFNNDKVLSSLEFFPSVNLIYNVIENSNLRASYSRTIARPSFKELSTAEIQDVLTGRTFIGNIDLVETNINNYDLRWEYFFRRAQKVSIGAFYKTFKNPIELVRQPNQPNDFKPTNVGDATIVGLEFELRKNFDFASERLSNLALVTNLTFTKAQVTINEDERQGRENGLRDGETLEDKRSFLGQPPFIVNTALNYNDAERGWEGSLSYNVQGRTLAVVGINRSPDTYDVPFNALNFNISKSFGVDRKNTIGFRVTNILDDDRDREFDSFMSDTYLETRRSPGRSFRIKFARNF